MARPSMRPASRSTLLPRRRWSRKVEAAVETEISRIQREGVDADELEKAKKRLVRSMIFEQDSPASMANMYGSSLTTGSTVRGCPAVDGRDSGCHGRPGEGRCSEVSQSAACGDGVSSSVARNVAIERGSQNDQSNCISRRFPACIASNPVPRRYRANDGSCENPAGKVGRRHKAWLVEDYSVPIISVALRLRRRRDAGSRG